MDIFDCGTKIVSGSGAVRYLEKLGSRRLFLVTDPFFYKNGTAQRIAAESRAETVEIFYDVRPDPTVELAADRDYHRLRPANRSAPHKHAFQDPGNL